MNYLFKIVFSLLLFIAINSCTYSQNTKVVSKGCIILNNKGVEYLSNYPMDGEAGLDTAINLFLQAIQCDSTYLTVYINIANAYDKKHNYHEEMKTYNKLLVLTNNHSPSMITQKGVLFERINDIDSAKKYYYLANKEYERELEKNPDNAETVKGLILIKALTVEKTTLSGK
jgi:tetratricopeptide (TPR) repeat protein